MVLKLSNTLKDFKIKLTLYYEEHYVLFDDEGNKALRSKDIKKKLVQHDLEY